MRFAFGLAVASLTLAVACAVSFERYPLENAAAGGQGAEGGSGGTGGDGGSGGGGSGGAGVGGSLGAACLEEAQCQEGLECWLPVEGEQDGPEGGLCTVACTPGDDTPCSVGGVVGVCHGFTTPAGVVGYCVEGCSYTNPNGKCHARNNSGCMPPSYVPTPPAACLPRCTTDAACPGTMTCSRRTGLCTNASTDGVLTAAEICSGSDDQCRGYCRGIDSTCEELCVIGYDHCGPDAECTFSFDESFITNNIGGCARTCDCETTDDCGGLVCNIDSDPSTPPITGHCISASAAVLGPCVALPSLPLVRYFIDEVAGGMIDDAGPAEKMPANVLEDAGNPSFIDDVTHGGGLNCAVPGGFGRVQRNIELGSKLHAGLDGSTTVAFELVLDIDGTGAESTLVEIGSPAEPRQLAVVATAMIGGQSMPGFVVFWNSTVVGEFIYNWANDDLTVLHLIWDTTQAVAEDRVRLYVDGVAITDDAALTLPLQDTAFAVPTGARLMLMNDIDSNQSWQGTLYYAAVYNDFNPDDVGLHASRLLQVSDYDP